MGKSMSQSPKILIINGGLGGKMGNTAAVLKYFNKTLEKRCQTKIIHLQEERFRTDLSLYDGFVFATGTYWDGWGSPLQVFFEHITHLEATDAIFGKPAAAIVTMHSMGGKSVLSRLQGVLNTFGFYIPPMSAMVYSMMNHIIIKSAPDNSFIEDVWGLEDLNIVANNLTEACLETNQWQRWEVDTKPAERRWITF